MCNNYDKMFFTLIYYRDVPTPVAEVKVGDFDGDGVVDILTLHSEVGGRQCYTPTLHLCEVTGDRIAVKSGLTFILLHRRKWTLVYVTIL